MNVKAKRWVSQGNADLFIKSKILHLHALQNSDSLTLYETLQLGKIKFEFLKCFLWMQAYAGLQGPPLTVMCLCTVPDPSSDQLHKIQNGGSYTSPGISEFLVQYLIILIHCLSLIML